MPKFDVQKIDAEIRKLEELKRFMSDPTTASVLERFFPLHGVPEAPTPHSKIPAKHPAQRGQLLTAVENTCKLLPGDFTANDVIEKLGLQGYTFQAKDKSIAVYS